MKFLLSFLICFCLSLPAFACETLAFTAAAECTCLSPVLVQSIETRTIQVPAITMTTAEVDVATYRLAYGRAGAYASFGTLGTLAARDVSTMRPWRRRLIERRLERHEFQDRRDRKKLGIGPVLFVSSLSVSAPVE